MEGFAEPGPVLQMDSGIPRFRFTRKGLCWLIWLCVCQWFAPGRYLLVRNVLVTRIIYGSKNNASIMVVHLLRASRDGPLKLLV